MHIILIFRQIYMLYPISAVRNTTVLIQSFNNLTFIIFAFLIPAHLLYSLQYCHLSPPHDMPI